MLVGTKRRVANERDVLVAKGRRDVARSSRARGQADTTTGITLLQVRFHERLEVAAMRSVLVGYDRRYDRLVDWVTETEGPSTTGPGRPAVEELLIEPISDMADHWRS